MKGVFGKFKILTAVFTVSVLLSSCSVNFGGFGPRKSYTRTIKVMAEMDDAATLLAHASFGNITAFGLMDTGRCNVTATIRGQAPTEEEAVSLVNQVSITLETLNDVMTIKADKPWLNYNRSIGIAYEITLPQEKSLDLDASYGSISIEEINGNVTANSSFGNVECKKITGNLNVRTSYGKVVCEEISSHSVAAHSSFGNVNIKYSELAPDDITTALSTSHGSIALDLPNKFAGSVDLSTSFGSIQTDIPIEVVGKFRKDKLTGSIGEGQGSIIAQTSFGSVSLK